MIQSVTQHNHVARNRPIVTQLVAKSYNQSIVMYNFVFLTPLATVRYSYPYAHNIQEKVMTEGAPLTVIGKVERWQPPLNHGDINNGIYLIVILTQLNCYSLIN